MTRGTMAPRAAQAPDVTDPAALLKRLADLRPGGQPVVSCVVRLEPEDRAGRRYLADVRRRVQAVRETLGALVPERTLRLAVERDLARVVDAVRSAARLPRTRGLAVYACETAELLAVLPLPRVRRPRLVVDRTAYVRELAEAEHHVGPILLAAVDRAHARLFEVTAFGATELTCVAALATRGGKFHSDRQGAPGWGERSFHGRIRAERERHYHAVAECLLTHDRDRPAIGFVIAGTAVAAQALARELDPSVATRLLGTTKLNPTALSPAQAHAAAMAVCAVHERATEADKVAAILEGLGSGRAVNGVVPTLHALFQGQVRELVLPADLELPGFRCEESRRLVVSAAACSNEGVPMAVPDLIDDAIEEGVRQGAAITAVYDPAIAGRIDGMAALLRYALEPLGAVERTALEEP